MGEVSKNTILDDTEGGSLKMDDVIYEQPLTGWQTSKDEYYFVPYISIDDWVI